MASAICYRNVDQYREVFGRRCWPLGGRHLRRRRCCSTPLVRDKSCQRTLMQWPLNLPLST